MKIIDKTLILFDIATKILFSVFVSLIFYNVVMRYLFMRSIGWIDEFCSFSVIWLTFLNLPALIESDEIFQVTILDDVIISKKFIKLIDIFVLVTLIVVFAILIYNSKALIVLKAPASYLPLSKNIIYSILPISLFISEFVLFRKLLKNIYNFPNI